MLKHVVILRIQPGLDREAVREEIRERLCSMPEHINSIKSLELGTNCVDSPAACDIVLITTHDDIDSYLEYQQHPHHQEIKKYLGSVTDLRTVVDFEVP